MKASEMTNEELAKELMSRVPLDSNRHDDIREAAATVAQEMLNISMQEITAERINGWASRLAEACEQTVTDCNQLGNTPRNCDVGTAEEQEERFDAHCRKHMGCLTCPLREKDGGVPKHCEFVWSQMPYEEGGARWAKQ